MKKLLISAAAAAIIGAAGYAAFERYKIYLPGLVSTWRDPVAPPRPVAWQQGPATAPAGPRPPNIVLIVADDLGYNDVSFAGRGGVAGVVPTPNIDAIAREGASFDQGYAANATCSPSRAALMTGRYPTRFGFEFTAVPKAFARNLSHAATDAPVKPIYFAERERDMPAYADMGVPASEITVAETLKRAGYHTVHVGKWHLGEAPAMRPEAQGFDESLGIMAGAGLFLPEADARVVNARLPWDPIDRFLWANLPYAVQYNGGQRFAPEGHVTDYFTRGAIDVIRANRNRPFFLYLAHTAPHTPLQALRSDYDALPQIKDHKTRVYGAMLRGLDRSVGEVMAELKRQGIDDNTLVIFTSDNGGAWYAGIPTLNTPFRGWKATFFEGGIRVPFYLRLPGRIAPGTRVATPAHHIDIHATAAALAGAPLPADRVIDGIDLLPLAAASEAPVARRLFWKSGHYRVVRDGDWKLQLSERPKRTWLFDLAADPTEQRDLSGANPAKVAELRAHLDAHAAGMPRPLWPALLEGPIRIDVPMNARWSQGQDYIYWAN